MTPLFPLASCWSFFFFSVNPLALFSRTLPYDVFYANMMIVHHDQNARLTYVGGQVVVLEIKRQFLCRYCKGQQKEIEAQISNHVEFGKSKLLWK